MKFLIFLIFSYFVDTVPTGGHNLIDFGHRETGKIKREHNYFFGGFDISGLIRSGNRLPVTGTTETPRANLAQITLT